MECPFCLPKIEPQLVLADRHCYAIWTRETPVGSAMVLPRAHRPTVFDLTDDEWRSTRHLLDRMKETIAGAAVSRRALRRPRDPRLDQGSGQPPAPAPVAGPHPSMSQLCRASPPSTGRFTPVT